MQKRACAGFSLWQLPQRMCQSSAIAPRKSNRLLALLSPVEVRRNAGVWTVRGGKVVRVAWFSSREEALRAAGLGE
jgi:hypothetical protein